MKRLWKSDRSKSCGTSASDIISVLINTTYVDEFLVSLVFRPTGLVLEHNVVVPSPLYVEVLGIEERITPSDFVFPLLLFLGGFFAFLLRKVSGYF